MPACRLGGEVGPCWRVVGDLPRADGPRRRIFKQDVRHAVAVEIAAARRVPACRFGREARPNRRIVADLPRADLTAGGVFEQNVRIAVAAEVGCGMTNKFPRASIILDHLDAA